MNFLALLLINSNPKKNLKKNMICPFHFQQMKTSKLFKLMVFGGQKNLWEKYMMVFIEPLLLLTKRVLQKTLLQMLKLKHMVHKFCNYCLKEKIYFFAQIAARLERSSFWFYKNQKSGSGRRKLLPKKFLQFIVHSAQFLAFCQGL